MRYRYEEIRALPAAVHQLALTQGQLDPTRLYIDLPDNFDFSIAEIKPTAVPRGLGDVVAIFAKPIARVIDGVLGTNLEHCAGCAQRQEDWNQAVPLPPPKP